MAHRLDSELTPEELARREYHRAWATTNKAHVTAYNHGRYLANKEERTANSRRYYRLHAEEYKQRARQQRIVHKEELKGYWRKHKTGCSPARYAELLKKQHGLCAICGKAEGRKRGAKAYELSADHDHVGGRIRGLLCGNCNLGIGNLQHDPKILRRALAYLR